MIDYGKCCRSTAVLRSKVCHYRLPTRIGLLM
jgi:hypothetical protein